MTAIRAQNPDTAIVLQIMNVPWNAPNSTALTKRLRLETFNDNYRHYAQDHHLPLLDHYPAWKKLEDTDPDKYHSVITDGTHPNKNGILLVMWPTLKDFLDTSRTAALQSPK
ncbi:MAG: SGNH/GDSL hydrolase family protein [Verrucomicrobiota bacterium]